MHRRILGALQAVALATLLASTPTLQASTIVAQSVETMSVEADAVALAEVVSMEPRWHDGMLITDVQLRILEVWAGDVEDTITLQRLGGTLDGVRTHVAGVDTYQVGEQVVVFMERGVNGHWRSMALSWAVFHRSGALVHRQTEGLQRIPPMSPRGQQHRASTAGGDLDTLLLDELRTRVRQAQESAQ